MKRFNLLLILLPVFVMQMRSQTMPLYLNFNSHNEISDNIQFSNSSVWAQYRSIVVTLADTFYSHGAKWNLQAESDFILADISNESGYANPNDLLDSLDATATVEVDPHNHFDNNPMSASYNPYNYSDLAHLLDSAGLTPLRTNLGGFLWQTASDWMPYQNNVSGNTYPFYSWRPDVIWGAGSPGHTNDYNGYGVWKPQGAGLQFMNHDPAKHLYFIGNGCSYVVFDTTHVSTIVNAVVQMLQYIQYQPYDPMAMYTASIQMNFRDMNSPGYADTIAAIVRGLEPYVNSGRIVYQTLSEKMATWNAAHSSSADYFRTDCQGLPLNTAEEETVPGTSLYPNPAHDVLNIQSASEPVQQIELIDINGKTVMQFEADSPLVQVNTAGLSPGMYFAIVRFGDGTMNSFRFVRE